MRSTPRRLAALLATSALAGAASLAWAGPLAGAPTWTPVHGVSGPVVATGEPGAILFDGPTSPQGFTATAAWAAWESGGVVHAAERPAALGAWAPAVPISHAAGGASDLDVDRNLAVWRRVVGGGTVIEAAIRTDGTWAPAEGLSAPGEEVSDPSVSDGGDPIVAWLRAEDGGRSAVEAAVRSRIGDGSWGEPVVLSDPSADASDVQVIPRGSGRLAIWRSVEGGESRIRAALYSASTGLWSGPIAVSPPGEFASEPRVAESGDGVAVAVWVGGAGPGATIHTANLVQGSAEWTAPTAISGPGVAEPALVVSGFRGPALAAWRRTDGADQVVEAAIRAADTGAWGKAERLSPEGEDAEAPAVAAGAVFRRFQPDVGPFDSAFQVAWTRPGDEGTAVMTASRPQGGGAWGAAQEIAPPGDSVEGLRLTVGNGEALALWRRDGGPVEGAAYDTQGPLYADVSIEPNRPRVGQTVSFSIMPIDTWSPVTRTEWDFGDGGTAVGRDVQHAYGHVPSPLFPVRVVLADAVGNETNLGGFEVRPFEHPAPAGPFGNQVVCASPAASPERGPTGRIVLSTRQLLVGQRIAQAAVRRANAIERWLDAGIETRDLCGGAFGTAAFAGLVHAVGGAASVLTPAADPRPFQEGSPAGGGAARVALTAGQLRVNQRIAQAALRRLDALDGRLRGGLTGGDIKDGAITGGQLAPGLEIRVIRPPAEPIPPTVTPPPDPPKGGEPGRIALTAGQLRINQRIAQAAVRRANALRLRLMTGLDQGDFRPATISAAKLDPSLRRG